MLIWLDIEFLQSFWHCSTQMFVGEAQLIRHKWSHPTLDWSFHYWSGPRVVVEGFRSPEDCQVYHRVLYWDPFCFCFILMTSHQSLLYRLGYLLMIASYTTPSTLVQTVRPCKGSWILWSDGVVHGAWSSIPKNVKLCPSPVESHILPICITYVVTYCPVSR